jgi:hypothetical protein
LDRRRQLLRRALRPGDEAVAVPAINTEGRALFEAVSSQGLFGMRARQRSSPYLPGVRSRLWRSVAVDRVPEVEASPAGQAFGGVGGAAFEDAGSARFERVLALIRRLPLEFDDEG